MWYNAARNAAVKSGIGALIDVVVLVGSGGRRDIENL